MSEQLPVLYSFRRCPYAMRARMALAAAGLAVELREILLKDKPAPMLAISSKGTVPVLQTVDSTVIDESLDVMHWALVQHDPNDWLGVDDETTESLIAENDGTFKKALDHYKYHSRFPEHSREYYREQGEVFLQKLEDCLEQHQGKGLVAERVTLADIAIFPFIRQFAGADAKWFEQSAYQRLVGWLAERVESALFKRVMKKHPLWQEGDSPLIQRWD